MNSIALARSGYGGASAAASRTPDAAEYQVFAQTTRRLIAAKTEPFVRLAEALHDNQRLWIVLAGAVADPLNRLPADLRARIFYLAEFTAAQTRLALGRGRGEDEARRADVDALIDVNTAIMRGLRSREDRAAGAPAGGAG